MANDFSSNPYYIDTAYTTGQSLFSNIRIKSIVWSNPGSIGDQLIVKDGAGKIIIATNAATANMDVNFSFMDGWFFGLQVPTIASGKILVYIR